MQTYLGRFIDTKQERVLITTVFVLAAAVGLIASGYGIYNHHLQAKINRKKIEEMGL
jgi:hypothetical protein